jgi:hypothetical protein
MRLAPTNSERGTSSRDDLERSPDPTGAQPAAYRIIRLDVDVPGWTARFVEMAIPLCVPVEFPGSRPRVCNRLAHPHRPPPRRYAQTSFALPSSFSAIIPRFSSATPS